MVGIQSVSVLFRFQSVVGFLCFKFGPVRPLVFFFFLLKIYVWAFFFFFLICSIQTCCVLALFGPFMLFVIKPFLETYFMNQFWPRFGPFLFWPFLGLFQESILDLFRPFCTSIKNFTNKKKITTCFCILHFL